MKKEEIHIIDRDDGKIRISYWNKAAGETSMVISRKIAREIERELKKLLASSGT